MAHELTAAISRIVVVITPPLLRDGGTARTAIQVHTVNLIELGYRKGRSPFGTSHDWLVAPPPTKRTAIGMYPRVVSYVMLGEQLHNCNRVKYEYVTCLPHKDRGVPLSALPKDTTNKLAGLFSTLSIFYT